MTLRLTVMMAETSRTSRVGAPGEDTRRSDPHWPGSATLPQPRAPLRAITLPFRLAPTLGALSLKFHSQLRLLTDLGKCLPFSGTQFPHL